MKRTGVLILWAAVWGLTFQTALAQSFLDQEKIEAVLSAYEVDHFYFPPVSYSYFIFDDTSGSRILARNMMYKELGEGDPIKGQERAVLLELLNRRLIDDLQLGDTLVVPSRYELDFRAYSPFPHYYEGAADFDKLVILDKTTQAFAAYEYGDLVRWGVINTGGPGYETPSGRFNFNWKEEFRTSLLSPEDEPWDMYWVFNFHDKRGIHVHQYAFPTGPPTSHGCVRLLDADARWIYHWADGWKTRAGGTGYESRKGEVIQQGTMVLVIGTEPTGDPKVFDTSGPEPVLVQIELPEHPYDVPPGTEQQKKFDRLRKNRSSKSTAAR
jgi:hypothetical protein